MESGYLTVNEASRYLGIKISTLYAMVERKEIPHYRVGRLIKFKKADLDAFMEEYRLASEDKGFTVRSIGRSSFGLQEDVSGLPASTN